jgi:putative lipase involved disintegration of autophagic bodies
MRHYYEVTTTCTTEETRHNPRLTTVFQESTKAYSTLEDVYRALHETYKDATITLTYRENNITPAKPTGLAYTFENADYSHSPIERWTQVDWVEVTEINETTVDPEMVRDLSLQVIV